MFPLRCAGPRPVDPSGESKRSLYLADRRIMGGGSRTAGKIGPHVRRRDAEAPPEASVEIGQIVEADLEGDGADGATGEARARQHAMSPDEPLRQQIFRERGAFP